MTIQQAALINWWSSPPTLGYLYSSCDLTQMQMTTFIDKHTLQLHTYVDW